MADAVSPSASAPPLRKTALHAAHVALGARMVPFGGWDMPVEYSGITAEHLAVRERVGLFDVSHMGEIEIAGSDALAAVQTLTSNDASKLAVGQIQYSSLPTPEGTVVDDVLVYRWAPEHFLLVVNAGSIEKDWAWIQAHIAGVGDAVAVNSSSRYALIAIQGPKAEAVLQPLTGVNLADLKYYWFAHGEFAGIRGTVSRTGYTGEDGFEIFCAPARPSACGRRCSRPGSPPASSRPVSAPGTRCAWKPRCGCAAATWTRRRRCSKPASAGSSAGRKPISSARRRSTRRRRPASRSASSASRWSIAASPAPAVP